LLIATAIMRAAGRSVAALILLTAPRSTSTNLEAQKERRGPIGDRPEIEERRAAEESGFGMNVMPRRIAN
jgi:hypothetical protein